jgi:hypothetical protein
MGSIFFSCLSFLFIAIVAVYGLGFSVLFGLKLVPDKKYTLIFSSLLSGITILVTATALFATRFNSVFLVVPILAGWLLWKLKQKSATEVMVFRLKDHLIYLCELGLFALLIYGFRYWFGYQVYGMPSIHEDLIYYAKLSGFILKSGTETSNIEYIYQQGNSVLPYHYFELWLNAAFIKFFRRSGVDLLYLVTYTLGSLAVWAGFCAIFESRTKVNWGIKLLCLICLALAGLDFSELRNQVFEYYVYLQFNVVFYPKLFPVYLFLIGAMLFYQHNREGAATAVLLFLPVATIIAAPGVLGGLFIFGAYQYFIRKKREGGQLLLALIALSFWFVLFYYFINHPASSPYKSHLSETLKQVISFERAFGIGLLAFRTLVQLLVTTAVFFVLVLPFLKLKNWKKFFGRREVQLGGVIFLAAFLSWAVLENMTDSLQFFTNLGVPLLNLVLFSVLTLAFVQARRKVVLIPLILIYLCLNFLEASKYMNVPPRYDAAYTALVSENVKQLNPIGGYFLDKSEYVNIYSKSSNIFAKGPYLAFTASEKDFHTLNLSVMDMPVNPENEAMERQLKANTSFYKFVAEQPWNQESKSIPELQLEFVNKHRLQYFLVSKAASLPETLAPLTRFVASDPVSGEKLYVLK